MKYPTEQEILDADQIQLCRWMRFLPSPGNSLLSLSTRENLYDYEATSALIKEEEKLLILIDKRHKESGGFTPEISKLIGW